MSPFRDGGVLRAVGLGERDGGERWGVLNEGCSGLWQIVRKPDAELSRLSRIEMPRMYRIRQNRMASKLSVDHRPIHRAAKWRTRLPSVAL